MQRHESYKPSGVKWIGDVPAHWAVLPGFTCYEENRDRNKGLAEKTVLSLSYGRIVVKSDEKMTGLVPESFDTYQLIKPGDIVIRTTDLQNDKTSLRVGLSGNKGMITSAYLGLKCKPSISSAYLYRVLESYDALKVFYGMGSGLRQNIDFWDFKRLPIPVPPRVEQDRIVAFLDQKVQELDHAVAKKEKLIELLLEQKRILINGAVTKGLDLNAPFLPSAIAGIGPIPAHWKLLQLKRVVQTKIADGPHETPKFLDQGIPFVSVEGAFEGRIDLQKRRGFISMKEHVRYCQKLKPQKDDVFFVKSGSTTGKTVIVDIDDEFSVWSPLALIRPKTDFFEPYFLLASIQSPYFQRQVQTGWSYGTQPNIGMSDLEKLWVIMPPIDEQKAILEALQPRLKKIDDVICLARSELTELQQWKGTLIAESVTGKIKI